MLFLGLPFVKGLAFQHSAAYALLKCLARGALNGIDEMIEKATIIRRTCVKSGFHEAKHGSEDFMSDVPLF